MGLGVALHQVSPVLPRTARLALMPPPRFVTALPLLLALPPPRLPLASVTTVLLTVTATTVEAAARLLPHLMGEMSVAPLLQLLHPLG